jgi:hypothetical protein
MATSFQMEPDGSFRIGKSRYRIPENFSDRQVHSFRTLLEPIPDPPSGTVLTPEQRRRQENFLMRRALAVVTPGLPMSTVQRLSMNSVRTVHEWIARNRPELIGEVETSIT